MHAPCLTYVGREGFDIDRLEVTGLSRTLLEGIRVQGGSASYFALSESGGLIYLPGSAAAAGGGPVWIDRDDSEQLLDPALTGLFETPAFSPDGRKVALQRQVGSEAEDIWIYDLEQRTSTRLTFGGSRNLEPFWSPDGTEVGFSSNREGPFALYARAADLSSETRLLVGAGDAPGLYAAVWTPDGRWLVYRRGGPVVSEAGDLWYAAPHPDSTPVQFSNTPYIEYNPSISPDGRWLAYQSDESGQFEVYVRPFPGPGGQVLVSVNGGMNPKWAQSGTEIFYVASDLSLTVATVRTDSDFVVQSRERLTSWPYLVQPQMRDYDLTPDDQSFMAIGSSLSAQRLIFVQNFFEELRQRMGN